MLEKPTNWIFFRNVETDGRWNSTKKTIIMPIGVTFEYKSLFIFTKVCIKKKRVITYGYEKQ